MKTLNYGILMLIPLLSWGAANACDLDQAERHKNNLQLQKKYPGSKYLKKSHTILISRGKEEISLNIGGCVHYGVAIELKTKPTSLYNDEVTLANKIYELSKEYSQGIIKPHKVKTVLASRQWSILNPDIEGYYLLDYDKNSTFEFYRRNEQGATYIGMYYYR